MNTIKKKQTRGSREQTSGYQWEEGRGEGQYTVEEEEGQTTMYKISYTSLLKTIGLQGDPTSPF